MAIVYLSSGRSNRQIAEDQPEVSREWIYIEKSTLNEALSFLCFLVLFHSLFAQAEYTGTWKMLGKLIRDGIPWTFHRPIKSSASFKSILDITPAPWMWVLMGIVVIIRRPPATTPIWPWWQVGTFKQMKEAKTLNESCTGLSTAFFDENINCDPITKKRWKASLNPLKDHQDNILAFYPLDEPYGKVKNMEQTHKNERTAGADRARNQILISYKSCGDDFHQQFCDDEKFPDSKNPWLGGFWLLSKVE